MSVKTPNFCLIQDFTHYNNGWGGEGFTLPGGAWVKPLNYDYVPKHIKEDKRWNAFNHKNEVFVYCRYGIIAVPKEIIKER